MILKACPAYRGCRATVPLGFCGLVALVSSWPGLLATVVQATPRRLTSRTLHWTAAGAGAGLDASGRRDWRGGSSARPASRRDTAVGGPGQAVAGGVPPGMGGAAGREHRRGRLRLHPDGQIVYSARNRVNDGKGPPGEIFGSALAHAETNVLARLPFRHPKDLILTTTLQPCL